MRQSMKSTKNKKIQYSGKASNFYKKEIKKESWWSWFLTLEECYEYDCLWFHSVKVHTGADCTHKS